MPPACASWPYMARDALYQFQAICGGGVEIISEVYVAQNDSCWPRS